MMNPVRKRKLLMVLFVIGILSLATLLVLYALRQNISLFFSPEQLSKGEAISKTQRNFGGQKGV